jgi:hypothetical protein
VSATNIKAVIPTKSTAATSHPPGMKALMLDGQNTDGRTNQARNEIGPFHGEQQSSALDDGVRARSKAVSQTMAPMRYASAAASNSRPTRATFRRMVAR